MRKFFSKSNFILVTNILCVVLSILYFWKGYKESFKIEAWVLIGMNLLYIPLSLIFQKKVFPLYCLVYSIVLIFILAFSSTCLYNNYSALFLIFVVVMLRPHWEYFILPAYFISVSVAFAMNEELLYHYFIHIVRCTWFIFVFHIILEDRFTRRTLNLTADEKKILQQMLEGKTYQKEVEGFSENTIYRKLKAARKRNGDISRDELLERFKKECDDSKVSI